MIRTKPLLAALAVAASTFAYAGSASAAEVTPWPELMMRAADANKDGRVTRQEFLEHMAKVWDEKHAAMMKTDSTMKVGAMTSAQFIAFMTYFRDPGQIGGN